jgi:hypothetical protein
MLVITSAAVPDIVPSHVSFEILGADGEWSACTSTVEGPAAISISGRETSDASPPESRAENDGHDLDQRRQAFAVVLTEPMLDNFTIDALPQNISQDLNMPDIDFMYHGQLDSPSNFTPEADLQSALGTRRYSPGAFDLARFYYDLLDDLPFKRFQNELSKKGVCSVHHSYQSLFVLTSQELTSGACARIHRRHGPAEYRSV